MGKKKKKTPPPPPESLGLPLTGVETHAHLDMGEFNEDMDDVFARAKAAGVATIGNVFLGPEAYIQNAPLFAQRENVFFLLGIHPHDATTCTQNALNAMEHAFTNDVRLKALGEIGLDYYYDHSPRDVQQQKFKEQLELARSLDKPVVIHSRDADQDTLKILLDLGFKDKPVLWHCFGKDEESANLYVSNGWHLSFPGPLTFPKNEELRQAAKATPLERMVLETDCPYLTPVPYRGKRNEPAYMAFTAQTAARCKEMDVEELWTRCGETARAFFGL